MISDLEKRYSQLVDICTRMNSSKPFKEDNFMCEDETIEDLIARKSKSKSKSKSFRSHLPPIKEDLAEN